MKEGSRKNKKLLYGLGIVVLILICVSVYSYTRTSTFVLEQYVENMNNGEFDKVYNLFSSSTVPEGIESKEVINYMKKYFNKNNFVKVVSKGKINNQIGRKGKHYYELEYQFQQKKIKNIVRLAKEKGMWKVLFPFKIEDIIIYAPLGANVYVDDMLLQAYEEGIYVCKNRLPDQYNVRIEYPNNICDDYITTIDVPRQTKVVSPYNTVSVTIKAPKGMVVSLGDQTQESETGMVNFYNVLEGKYKLSVTNTYNYTKPYEKEVIVDETKRIFGVSALTLSEDGAENLQDFVNKFYGDYVEGIENKDSSFISEYISRKISKQIQNVYEEWFIDKKKIVDANMKVVLQGIHINEEGQLELTVLESIELINQENKKDFTYKVVLKTKSKIDIVNENWEIVDRDIEESIVAYKDEANNWIEYE